jgi:ribosomal-protein-alanine N-acetyltransferase
LIFETLAEKHVDLLFQFELENKKWFESLISPRAHYFYTYSGVKMHIFDSIIDMKLGTHYSGVLISNDRIVARGNLKDISVEHNNTTVGYRVAEKSIGKGYATYCLAELIKIAGSVYSINEIQAQVLDNNLASKAVLNKLGFKAKFYEENFIELGGVKLGCTTFSRISANQL